MEWLRFIVAHYHDEAMEEARRECVRIIAIKANGDYKRLQKSDVQRLFSIAEKLRAVAGEGSR